MKSLLHVLHLEDDLQDAELAKSTLEADGIACEITRVQTQPDFVAALERGGIDLVLSDFSLPGFDGRAAAELVRARWPAIPLILVSGKLGEESAIEALKSGATDYVLKQRLTRLAPAVRRAMQEVAGCVERRRLEAQVIQAQKMEVVGHLAGGVAHDFNNILAIIMGYVDLISLSLTPESPLCEYTTEINHACERATGLTRQLLVFSRKQKVQPFVLDFNAMVTDLEPMLRRLITENIEMTVILAKLSGRVKADPGYVGQVLMNLVVNARDAMPEGGKITITTGNVTQDEIRAREYPHGLPAEAPAMRGDYVLLSVNDTGTGMTAEVKTRLFDAFFTTKPKGKGTGLGLATCQTIVHQSGGHIGVHSEVGKGSTFNVYFPRVDLPLASETQFVRAGPLPRGTETLLVVEDEPLVRQLACSVLKSQGYEVLCAANGEEGLAVARAHNKSPIRLVVTDVIMPRMGGKEMTEWLKTAHPQLKILFTSGYTDDAITPEGVLDSGVEFLAKPYASATLVRKVRELLDQADPSRPRFEAEPPAAPAAATR